MCNFFSFISDGMGKTYYFNWKDRKSLLLSNPKKLEPDSHASIAEFYHLDEDRSNKYEYNPFLKKFTVDQINNADDSFICERWVRKLDFKKVVQPLIIKPVINLFKTKAPKISQEDIKLLKNWSLVWDSVKGSVVHLTLDSIEDSVGGSVSNWLWDYFYGLIYGSPGDLFLTSLCDYFGNSICYPPNSLVLDSIRDSIWAYVSSFFAIKYNYDFSSVCKLWEKGLVPSFDGKIWRLHSGPRAKIVYEWEHKQKVVGKIEKL